MSKEAYYFPHPQPLVPTTKAQPKRVGNKVKWVEEGKGVRRGVGTTQSIYYLWFEYLKRSDKYKKACGYKVAMTKEEAKEYKTWRAFKGTKSRRSTEEILREFGDIFKLKTDANGYTDAEDFYRNWWEKDNRGARLFGIRAIDELKQFASVEDVLSLQNDIDDYEIVVLPKNLPKTIMRKRVGELITALQSKDVDRGKARYPIVSERVDVESLRNCLDVYDLMATKEYTAVEVYAKVFGIKVEHKHLDLFTDARSERGMLRDYAVREADDIEDDDAWLEANKSADMEAEEQREAEALAYAERKMEWRKTQRVESAYDDGKGDFFKNTRALSKAELEQLKELYIAKYLGLLVKSPKSEERAKAKNYYKQQVYRLLRKAKANIEAVEKGHFGVGH